MVQRKAPPKLLLGILHADQANNQFEKPRFGRNLGPSSPKNQDSLGLTKKMKKKSRSITKKSDPENLLKFRNEVSLPGKPPPEAAPEPVRRSESSPNYMKSTSSSDARKERSQVSPQTTTPPKTKSSKSSAKTSIKTTSLKLGRTLTKSPSFKPARSSSSTKKKPPQVVLGGGGDVLRATCSSTLKESKFPSYLQLSHGATESEGTSAMKVCPYTYCSLNGHRHTQHPPLKAFLSARRRTLKAQKSTKLGCSSPGRTRPGGEKEDIGIKHMILLDDDKPIEDGFLIEIYVRGEKDDAAEETNSSIGDKDIAEVISSEEEQLAEEWTHDHSDSFDVETTSKAEEDGSEPENCDMEWEEEEEGQYSAPSAAAAADDDDGQNVKNKSLSGGDYDLHLLGDEYSFGWFNDMSSCKFDEIPSHEGPEEISEEERASSEISDSSSQNWGRIGYYAEEEEFENYNTYPLCSSPFEEVKKSGGESDENSELDYSSEGTSITLAPIEEPVEEDQSQVLEAGSTGCELSHGDSTHHLHDDETYEEEEDYYRSSDDSEGYHQSETDGEEMVVVAESLIDDKIGNLEANQALHAADNCPVQVDARATTTNEDETRAHSFDKKSPSDNIDEDEDEFVTLNHVILSQNKTDDEEDTDETVVDYAATMSSGGPEVCSSSSAVKTVPFIRGVRMPDEEQSHVFIKLTITKGMRSEEELEDPRKFNPREPNYLPVKPDPEAEKVDLRHQMMEERKASQEWMVDYALRQTVDKLATAARKKKVALLVEAFEKVVTPIPKYQQQSHLRHTPSAFAHTRFVQACS